MSPCSHRTPAHFPTLPLPTEAVNVTARSNTLAKYLQGRTEALDESLMRRTRDASLATSVLVQRSTHSGSFVHNNLTAFFPETSSSV